jgi:hypothetical protein
MGNSGNGRKRAAGVIRIDGSVFSTLTGMAAAAISMGILAQPAAAGTEPEFGVWHSSSPQDSFPPSTLVDSVITGAQIVGHESSESASVGWVSHSSNLTATASVTTLSLSLDVGMWQSQGPGGNTAWYAVGETEFAVHDLVFSSTDGSGGNVGVQLNAELCSSHSGFCTHNPPGEPDPPCVQAPFQHAISGAMGGAFAGYAFIGPFVYGNGGGGPVPQGCITPNSPTTNVNLNGQPHPFGIRLSAWVVVDISGAGQSDFSSVSATLKLGELQPDGRIGPIFNLPGNVTANAPSINLVDNYILPPPPALVIDANTTPEDLDELVVVDGNLQIIDIPVGPCLSFANLTEVNGSILAYQIPENICLDMPGASVGGDIVIGEIDGGVTVDVGSNGGDVIIGEIDGGVVVETDNSGGDVIIGEVNGGVVVDSGGGGDVIVGGNNGGVVVDSRGGGDVIIGGNSGGVVVVDSNGGGDVIIGGNNGGVVVDSGGGGDVIIGSSDGGVVVGVSGDSEDIIVEETGESVEVTTVGDVNGDIEVTNVFTAEDLCFGTPLEPVTITLGGEKVTGKLMLTGNGPTTLTTLQPVNIGGNLHADNLVQSPLDLSTITVDGTLDLEGVGSDPIIAPFAAGGLNLIRSVHCTDALRLAMNNLNGTAGDLITIDRIGGAELPAERGRNAEGDHASLDPLCRYTVAITGTHSEPATIRLALDLASLSTGERKALAAALVDGKASIAVSDGSMLTALPLCPAAAEEGCTEIVLLDAAGLSVPFEDAVTIEFGTRALSADLAAVIWDSRQACSADIAPQPNGDGLVNISDIQALIEALGLPCNNCVEDIAPPEGDKAVSVSDILHALQTFGTCH